MSESGPAMQEPLGGSPQVGFPAPGFRLPAATRLGPVHLQVANLERSVRYYREVLGLSEVGGAGPPAEVRLGAVDGTPLVDLTEKSGAAPVARRGLLGLYHFALLLPGRADLGAFLGHLSGSGVRPGMSDHSVSEAIYLTDPDGLGIEIYADRPRNAWNYQGRELHMTTEPLDVQGVLSAAVGPWQGIPAGTVMGHVHLFVGDLERATDFYHRALGFDRTVWSYPGALFLSAGGYHHHLGTNTWAAAAPAAGPGDARLLRWRLTLPSPEDVASARHALERSGFSTAAEENGWSASDPWGTRLTVAWSDGEGENVPTPRALGPSAKGP